MKNPARRLFVISSVLFLVALPSTIYPQTRNRIEPLPKLLSVREQKLVRESWLKKRLDTMLLPMMRQQKIEMWIVTNEEFHADPVTPYIAPPIPYVGRRDFFIFADRGGDKLDRLALVRYPEEALEEFLRSLESSRQRNRSNLASHCGRTKTRKQLLSTWEERAARQMVLLMMPTNS